MFIQDEQRAKLFDNFIKKLKKGLNRGKKGVKKIENLLGKIDDFKHSGLACRRDRPAKLAENNAIQKVD